MTPASPLVTYGIGGLAVLVALAIIAAYRRASRSAGAPSIGFVIVPIVVWMTLTGFLASRGWFRVAAAALPVRFGPVLVGTLVLGFAGGLSRVGRAFAMGLPLADLVLFHAFRLPLELVMHQAALEGTMPEQMAYTGWNFDIATGFTALLLGVVLRLRPGVIPRSVVMGWNILGTTLLITIVSIAVASLPAFHLFGEDPRRINFWVLDFPFVWLPATLVCAALFGHVVIWRRLREVRNDPALGS